MTGPLGVTDPCTVSPITPVWVSDSADNPVEFCKGQGCGVDSYTVPMHLDQATLETWCPDCCPTAIPTFPPRTNSNFPQHHR
jgi:hypothetical protein